MKRSTLPKNWNDELFNASLPCFIIVNTIWIYAEISLKQHRTFDTYVKAKMTKFFSFASEITEI
jgi:hypothetical protein